MAVTQRRSLLLRNAIRTFGKRKFQLLAIGIIMMISSLIYTAMFMATSTLRTPMEDMMESTNIEDFSFDIYDGLTADETQEFDSDLTLVGLSLGQIYSNNTDTFYSIVNDRMDKISAEFNDTDFTMEPRVYKTADFDATHTLRIYKAAQNIDTTYLEEGTLPQGVNEIALNRTYAQKNNLEIGDLYTVGNTTYTITGYILYSDYNMPLDLESFTLDSAKQGVGALSSQGFDALEGSVGLYIAGKAGGETTSTDIIDKVISDFELERGEDDYALPFVTAITLTANQMRSGAIYEEIEGGQAITLGMAITIALIAVLMTAIVLSRILASQRPSIGVLKSLGYTAMEIGTPYLLVIALVSLPMMAVGYFIGNYLAEPLKAFYLDFYMLPNVAVELIPGVAATAIFVPLAFLLLLSTYIMWRMLRKPALILMRPSMGRSAGRLARFARALTANAKITTRFRATFLTSNPGKFVLYAIGIVFASFLMVFASLFTGFSERMSTDYYKAFDYEYESYVDFSVEQPPELERGEERFLSASAIDPSGKIISITGIEPSSKIHALHDSEGKDITYKLVEYGVVLTGTAAQQLNKEEGDFLQLTVSGHKEEFTIVGITKAYGPATVFVGRPQLSKILTENKTVNGVAPDGVYNGIYGLTPPDDDYYASVISKRSILEQSSQMSGFINYAFGSITGSAFFIAILIVYVLTSLAINDSTFAISLLKVLGYDDFEVSSMMLRSYFWLTVVVYLISVPLTIFIMRISLSLMTDMYGMTIPIAINIRYIVYSGVLIVLVYLLGSWRARTRINTISLQEVLKEYDE